uniref:Uncharacterized protein n=1 Tax=viral metagenome TaxID=1070528 RepID=A0A6C0CCP5_9ZZZZ
MLANSCQTWRQGTSNRNATGLCFNGLYSALPYEQVKNIFLEVLEKIAIEYIENLRTQDCLSFKSSRRYLENFIYAMLQSYT